jgi:hypothetical protein
MVSGGTLTSSKQQYVTRKLTGIVTMANSVFNVTGASNNIPDGCKILKVVAKNLTGRTLTLEVPVSTVMMDMGTVDKTFGPIKKFVTAPLSRFPTIKVNIPDLLALPITNDASQPLFTLGSLISSATDAVELTYTVRYAL